MFLQEGQELAKRHTGLVKSGRCPDQEQRVPVFCAYEAASQKLAPIPERDQANVFICVVTESS
jgi:hypothetical protein